MATLLNEPQSTSMKRVAMASFVGSAIEYYDFYIYGTAAALVFNQLFFPEFDPLIGTLLAFTTFAVGFVARPLGGGVRSHRLVHAVASGLRAAGSRGVPMPRAGLRRWSSRGSGTGVAERRQPVRRS